MSQETLNLLVGALIGIVSSLLSQIVGNYLQQKNDERKRKWELEDRQFNQRLEIRNKRIEDARILVDKWMTYIQSLRKIALADVILNMDESDNENVQAMQGVLTEDLKKINSSREFLRDESSFVILNDKELLDLRDQYNALVLPQQTKLFGAIDKFEDVGTLDASIDELVGLLDVASKADELIMQMKIRLDKMAQTVP